METYPASGGLVPQLVYNKSIGFKTIISNFENGVEQRRNKWSGGKLSFNVVYNAISDADTDTLWNFYVARKGSYDAFYFVDPISTTTYTVRFAEDNLSRDEIAYQLVTTGVKLIQVL